MPDIDAHTFASHVELMQSAGLVEARLLPRGGGVFAAAAVLRLTWAGADFLDAARSDTLWAKAKKSVIAPTASWTLDVLTSWLKEQVVKGLGSGF